VYEDNATPMADDISIAYFITAHGFGHACRSAAIMEAILRRHPRVRFELFTTCPRDLFSSSIGGEFGYHPVSGDIGVVQLDPLREDLSATCDRLDSMYPLDPLKVEHLATEVVRLNCRLVICDIAPMGIEVARSAEVESVLVENFTWDWIYESYRIQEPRFKPHSEYLARVFRRADHHIQTPPICRQTSDALCVAPISRRIRADRHLVRKRLGIPEKERMVFLTMGGTPDCHAFLSRLPEQMDWHLVVTGADTPHRPKKKVTLLPTFSNFFHPDLLAAADVLVGKAGYSTVAEAYHCGIPFGYVKRPRSPESAVLESFIEEHLPSLGIPAISYTSGDWIKKVPELFQLPRGEQERDNGANELAEYVCKLLCSPSGLDDSAA